ncbi:unnamed protein product [Trichogramma brassicae]|uniref:Uncharacterized protein n=1 Tax=Trichogramma brassicae TaxID=86971 RepID=A0A6H5IS62_9HYME|nr:unnamed protein product [Trichogramma brassicae]
MAPAPRQVKWRELKSLGENIDWERKEERAEVLDRLETLLRDWGNWNRAPNLRDTFTPGQIERLLADPAVCWKRINDEKIRFIDLVAETGYRGQLEVDDRDGEAPLRRTTALHRAANYYNGDIVKSLFVIYDEYDANYGDEETGKTHFHVACEFGCVQAVEKFLEAGQDPNVVWEKTGDTPLHLAADSTSTNRKYVIESLLRGGADPNLANAEGFTPLHILCCGYDDVESAGLFFRNDDETVRIDAKNKRGHTALQLAIGRRLKNVLELLLRRGADPNLAAATGSTPLHYICARGFDEFDVALMQRYFQVCDDIGKTRTVQIDARDNEGRTPLHLAMLNYTWVMVKTLLERGADPTSADKHKSTPLHNICKTHSGDGFIRKFFKSNDSEGKRVQVNAEDESGDTPLHLALRIGSKATCEYLLRRDANPDAANKKGWTPLHVVCGRRVGRNDLVNALFEVGCEQDKRKRVDARDNLGRTPLHLALARGHRRLAESLLVKGADPVAADAAGSTPLHYVCDREEDDAGSLELLFESSVSWRLRRVRIDARDESGRTPLHLALAKGCKKPTESLLRRGADPNLADNEGSTPLHVICRRKHDDDLAKKFFEINDELNQTVRVDAVDKKGRTPLQWAVVNFSSKLVEYLLARGADMSTFVFPSEVCFADRIVSPDENKANFRLELVSGDQTFVRIKSPDESSANDRLRLASGALTVVKRLQKEGYKLVQRDATMMMKLFKNYGLFEATDLRRLCRDNQRFEKEAKTFKIRGQLWLYGLIHLPPKEATKKLASVVNHLKLKEKLSGLDKGFCWVCDSYLSEILLRKFCKRWALDLFYTNLLHRRLPVEMCEIVLEPLTNQDLCNICLAAPDINDDKKSKSRKGPAKIKKALKRLRK